MDKTLFKPTSAESRAAIVLVKAAAADVQTGVCKGYQWNVVSSRGVQWTVTARIVHAPKSIRRPPARTR